MATPEHHANSGTPSAHDVGGGIMEEAKYIWHDVRLLIHDHLKLATLETKLVAESLVSMIATSVAVVLLVVTAWLGLVSAGVVAMIEQGLSASIAILIAVAVNLVLAVVLGIAIRKQVSHLQWPATLRSLHPNAGESVSMPSIHAQESSQMQAAAQMQASTGVSPSNATRH